MNTQLTTPNNHVVRAFRTEAGLKGNECQFVGRAKAKLGIIERAMQPTSGAPFLIGQGAVGGAALVGFGALCYDGLGMSSGTSALENSLLWPQYVKDRIRSTYMYFGGSIILTAVSAAAASRSPALMNSMKTSLMSVAGSTIAFVGTGMVVRSIPYTEGFGAKQLGWMLHTGVVGVVVAAISKFGGPLILRAAWMTAGIQRWVNSFS